jgi:hypothetical protein
MELVMTDITQTAEWREAVDELIDYALHYGSGCRDCADNGGVCDSGRPCNINQQRAVLGHGLKAWAYGLQHGFVKPDALTAALPHLLAALSRPAAPAVEIKPLVWVKPYNDDTVKKSETAIGLYKVWTHHEAKGAWFWSLLGDWHAEGVFSSEQDAIDGAEAHYRSCLRPALSQAVREAYERAAQLIQDHGIMSLGSGGYALMPRTDGDQNGIFYAEAILALASGGGGEAR